jgi:hypothetical protein
MHWKSYAEARGRPPDCEVVIRFDPRDESHPFLRRRVAGYESDGKAVVLRPTVPGERPRRKRRPASIR